MLFLNVLSFILNSGSICRDRDCIVLISGYACRYNHGTEVIFVTATGPTTAFGGEISGEKILPLRVILLVPVILLMSELSSLKLSS